MWNEYESRTSGLINFGDSDFRVTFLFKYTVAPGKHRCGGIAEDKGRKEDPNGRPIYSVINPSFMRHNLCHYIEWSFLASQLHVFFLVLSVPFSLVGCMYVCISQSVEYLLVFLLNENLYQIWSPSFSCVNDPTSIDQRHVTHVIL